MEFAVFVGDPQRLDERAELAPYGPVRGALSARGTEQLETLRFEAVNPTFVLSVSKAL